jgi:tetratricopeptide (TPR) repeat protein
VAVFHARKFSLRVVLGAAVVLKPAVWLLWVLAPLTAASLVERSSQRLQPFLPSLDNPNRWYLSTPNSAALATAYEEAFAAVKANPFNGDAWYWASMASLRLYTVNPEEGAALGNFAIHAAQRAVELAPDDANSLIVYGATLLMKGEREKALTPFRNAVDKAPNNLSALLMLSDILGQRPETRQEAVDILHFAEKLNPAHTYIKQRLSFLQLGSEQTQTTTSHD